MDIRAENIKVLDDTMARLKADAVYRELTFKIFYQKQIAA